MDISSLKEIIEILVDKPAYGFTIALVAGLISILVWYASSYVKEAAKQRVTGLGQRKEAELKASSDSLHNRKGIPEGKHFSIVTFADGISAEVNLSLTFKVVDAYKYTYESNDPLSILSVLVDGRLRHAYETISVDQARERRLETANLITNDVVEEFFRYGIELKSVVIGGIRVINQSKF